MGRRLSDLWPAEWGAQARGRSVALARGVLRASLESPSNTASSDAEAELRQTTVRAYEASSDPRPASSAVSCVGCVVYCRRPCQPPCSKTPDHSSAPGHPDAGTGRSRWAQGAMHKLPALTNEPGSERRDTTRRWGALACDDRVLTRLSFGTAHRQRSNCHDLSHVGQTLEPGVPALPRTDISRRRRAVACVSRGNLAYREPLMLASCPWSATA
jgi:hypothetical protein